MIGDRCFRFSNTPDMLPHAWQVRPGGRKADGFYLENVPQLYGRSVDGVPGLTSEDGHTALLPVALAGDPVDATVHAEPVVALVEAADAHPDFRMTTVGEGSVNVEFEALSEETLVKGETYGLSIALVILVLVFGALVAAGIPLLLAIVSIVLATGITALIGSTFDLSFFVSGATFGRIAGHHAARVARGDDSGATVRVEPHAASANAGSGSARGAEDGWVP